MIRSWVKGALCGAVVSAVFLGGVADAAPTSPEQQWRAYALAAGLSSPLTPAEQACYEHLASCYPNVRPTDTPALYYTTRVYVHIAQQTVDGIADPAKMPDRTGHYDAAFVTAKERLVIAKALDMAIAELLILTGDHVELATWTTVSPTDPTFRNDYDLSMRSGVLTLVDTQSNKINGVHGEIDTDAVPLRLVKYFKADTYPEGDGSVTYRIEIATNGDQDNVHTHWDKDEGTTTDRDGGGTALFDQDQRALRDDIYRKLCALIHQSPVINP